MILAHAMPSITATAADDLLAEPGLKVPEKIVSFLKIRLILNPEARQWHWSELRPLETSLAAPRKPRFEWDSLSKWIEMANDPQPQVRTHATRALGRMAPDGWRAEPTLINLLKDSHGGVRAEAAIALGEFQPQLATSAVAGLTELLDDKLWYVRDSAAESLGKLGPLAKNAAPKLTKLLGDRNWRVRKSAATALAKIGPALAATAPSPADPRQDSAAGARETAELRKLIEETNDPNPNVRVDAVIALRNMGASAKSAVPALTRLLNDQESGVRDWAAQSLGAIGSEAQAAVPALTKLLDDGEWFVCESAAESLGGIGPEAKTAVPGLTKLLENKTSMIRVAAANALGKIGPGAKTAIPCLLETRTDSDANVREAALTCWRTKTRNSVAWL